MFGDDGHNNINNRKPSTFTGNNNQHAVSCFGDGPSSTGTNVQEVKYV